MTAESEVLPLTVRTAQASQLGNGSGHPQRGTPDLDDFSSGFGLWSGTSFAAPALAGDIARKLGTDRPAEAEKRSAVARDVVAAALEAAAKVLEEER